MMKVRESASHHACEGFLPSFKQWVGMLIAPVLNVAAGGEPSTWFTPGRLVEQKSMSLERQIPASAACCSCSSILHYCLKISGRRATISRKMQIREKT